MGLYIDTSCLLKLLFLERESSRVQLMVATEKQVIVSSLVRLETMVRIQGRLAGGLLSKPQALKLCRTLEHILQADPFEFRPCSAILMKDAEKQIFPMATSVYCRTLDRLHLAAITTFGIKRLFTNDEAQATGARGLGLEVIMPR